MREAVIVGAVRTPTGKFLGALKDFPATALGALVVAEVVRRAGIDPALVDEVIMGNVVTAGLGQNPARQAALGGGLNPRVAALTVNKVCGSGLKAVALAAQGVMLGENEYVVAGGQESMSNCPYLLPGARNGYRIGNAELVDSMIRDGLWEVYENFHMGVAAELVADKYKISRQEQDQFAFESHQKAVAAMNAGYVDSQIVPVEVPQKTGVGGTYRPLKQTTDPVVVRRDESPRADTTLEALGKLRPPFKKDGTVTAGNAPGTNDGAAAVVVTSERNAAKLGKTPLARIVAQSVSGIEPKWLLMAPIEAVEKLLKKTGWDRDRDVDLYEMNEAFAVQALAVMRELHLDPAKINVNGGAVAIGHPIGASGARILVTLLYEMQRRNAHRGIAALCLGGGNAVALAVER